MIIIGERINSSSKKIAEAIEKRTSNLSKKVGARFSPGYGRWNLGDQEVLFHLCDTKRVGVSLNDQYMMIPRKSVSFCIGIGRELVSNARINSCRHCNMKECPYRKGEEND